MSPSSTRLLDRMLQLEARVSRLEGGGAGPSSGSADGPKVPHSKGLAAQAEEGERHDPEAYLMVEVGAFTFFCRILRGEAADGDLCLSQDVAMGGRREKRARLAMDAFPSSTSSSLRSSPVPRPLPQNHTVKTPTLAPTPTAASTATLTKTKLARDRKRARKGTGASKRPRKVEDIDRILALMPDAATTRILIDFYVSVWRETTFVSFYLPTDCATYCTVPGPRLDLKDPRRGDLSSRGAWDARTHAYLRRVMLTEDDVADRGLPRRAPASVDLGRWAAGVPPRHSLPGFPPMLAREARCARLHGSHGDSAGRNAVRG